MQSADGIVTPDNLIRATDISDTVFVVDMWRIRITAWRREDGGALYYRCTVGGKEYGPYATTQGLREQVENDLKRETDLATKRYRIRGLPD